LEALEDRLAPTCNIISGFVYQDGNNNGTFDAGELPIANSTVQLRNSANQIVGSTTTNAQGYYQFDHDATISTAPTTLTRVVNFQNAQTDFNLTGLLDQFNPELGTLQSIEITHAGSITSEIQVENISTMSGSSITGTVSGTLNLTGPNVANALSLSQLAGSVVTPVFDGTIDFAGTSGASFGAKTAQGSNKITLTGANINAYIGTGKVTVQEAGTATSVANGGGNIVMHIVSTGAASITVVYNYIPSDCLKPGNYTIVQTAQPAGFLDGKEAKGGVPVANSVGADVIAVTLGSADLANNNFGEVAPSQLSGFVYHDVNNNGIKDQSESGIAGVQITLTGTDDLGSINKTAVTDAAGSYQFLTLRPGTYNVAEAQPGGYLDGKDTAGSKGGTVSNDLLSAINLPAGSTSINNNFGELIPASIAGFVYVDANNNGVKDPGEQGIAGAAIALSGFTADGPVSKQATTDGAGAYAFTNLVPGTYGIQETQPAAYLDGKDAVGTQGGSSSNDQFTSIALASGTNGLNNNFGELTPASISGFVYADANNNGVKDAGEAAISGVTVTLSGSDEFGAVSKTATTDAGGAYQFLNLRPGNYGLNESQPSGFIDGKDAVGTQGGVTGNDTITSITLVQGTNGLNNNFGELPPAGLSGFVYHDANENGLKDAGEAGISGVTVTLTGNDDVGAVQLTAQTDATGAYKFQNLRPGNYTITETHPSQYKDGQDAIGSQGGTAGNDVLSNIVLAAGVLGVNNNFGELIPENADLTIVKSASAPAVRVGDTLTYTLTVTNLGQFTAKNVVVTDDLPFGAGLVSASGVGWTINAAGGVVTATRDTLAVGAPSNIFITIAVPPISSSLLNHAHVASSTPDTNPLNNDSSVTTPVVVDPPAIRPLATRLGQVPITSKKQLTSGAGSKLIAGTRQDLAFLDGVYQTLLGRRPTKQELGAQALRLKKNRNLRGTIITELWYSDGHRAVQANQLYATYLHRLPTPFEQANVTQQLKAGVQETSIAAQLVGSSEYLAAHPTSATLAGGLYLDLLGRLPDANANQSLVQSLANETVTGAALNLLASQEGRQFTVDGIYRAILHRPATVGEQQFGALQLQTGVSAAQIAINLLASLEFYQLAFASLTK
jgi:uncharacterized repeat protein (TIGR01451 family)